VDDVVFLPSLGQPAPAHDLGDRDSGEVFHGVEGAEHLLVHEGLDDGLDLLHGCSSN